MKDAQTTLTIYMMMVVAIATTFNAIVPPIIAARRDKRLAAGTARVAEKAQEAVTHLNKIEDKVNATHVIVNSQKTALMQKLMEAQRATLLLAQAMLADSPRNNKLKEAVAAAQALYDASTADLLKKVQE